MKSFSRSHLSDAALRRVIVEHHAAEHGAIAEALADLAEYDARKLYRPDGYSSIFAYCVEALGFEREYALKRIRVARVAREFPAIFAALADGSLNLSAVILLKPHLDPSTANDLLASASHKTRSEIELLLAERFPRPDVATRIEPLPAPASASTMPGELAMEVSPGTLVQSVSSIVRPPRVAPISVGRYAIQGTVSYETNDLIREIEELQGCRGASDLERVLNPALRMFAAHLRKSKFGAGRKPRPHQRRVSKNPRYVPDHVKREVWARDGGQCTFESDAGHRCTERKDLQFDHVQEVARGSAATAPNIRLRCRAHNQFAAERTFGVGFMERKREETKRAAEESRAADERNKELTIALRSLGYRADQAKAAAEYADSIPDAPLELRIRRALAYFRPKGRTYDVSGVEKVWERRPEGACSAL